MSVPLLSTCSVPQLPGGQQHTLKAITGIHKKQSTYNIYYYTKKCIKSYLCEHCSRMFGQRRKLPFVLVSHCSRYCKGNTTGLQCLESVKCSSKICDFYKLAESGLEWKHSLRKLARACCTADWEIQGLPATPSSTVEQPGLYPSSEYDSTRKQPSLIKQPA